jgi:hypothetical protein
MYVGSSALDAADRQLIDPARDDEAVYEEDKYE